MRKLLRAPIDAAHRSAAALDAAVDTRDLARARVARRGRGGRSRRPSSNRSRTVSPATSAASRSRSRRSRSCSALRAERATAVELLAAADAELADLDVRRSRASGRRGGVERAHRRGRCSGGRPTRGVGARRGGPRPARGRAAGGRPPRRGRRGGGACRRRGSRAHEGVRRARSAAGAALPRPCGRARRAADDGRAVSGVRIVRASGADSPRRRSRHRRPGGCRRSA